MTCTASRASNPVAVRNLYIPQGTDWSETFSILDSAGAAIDLTGYTLAGQVRATQSSAATLVFAFSFSISTTVVTVSVARATTTALTVGTTADSTASKFWYDYELTTPGGVRRRIQEGTLTIKREITA